MPYFTSDELRALPDMDDTARFSDERLGDAHDWIVGVIERECDTSFIAKAVTEVLDGTGLNMLLLTEPYVQSLTSVTVNGVTVDTTTVLLRNGALYYKDGSRWDNTAIGNTAVAYQAGYSTEPPADLKEAALRGARNWLLSSDAWSGADSRATSITNDYGNIQIAVAGPDRPTGWPDVDATILAWARRVRVPKVS